MSKDRYLTIEESALELAEVTFDEIALRNDMESFGIPETKFNEMKVGAIEARQKSFIDVLNDARRQGNITVREPSSKLPYSPKTQRNFCEVISVNDLNTWLQESGVDYKLKMKVIDVPQSKQTKTQNDADWKELAREKADLIYQNQRKNGSDPSKRAIANLIAKEFEAEGIKTEKEKRLNGEYITRHALNTWNRPRK